MITKTFMLDGDKPVIRVTFSIPSGKWTNSIYLVGDFNEWNHTSHPLLYTHEGDWIITLCLDVDKVYQFRYLCDGHEWMNDCAADGYTPNQHGSSNSLLITQRDFASHIER